METGDIIINRPYNKTFYCCKFNKFNHNKISTKVIHLGELHSGR